MPERTKPIFRFVRWLFKCYFATHGGLTAIGSEKVPAEGGLILAPVHMSHLDAPALACGMMQRSCGAMSKEGLFKVPIIGRVVAAMGAEPIKKGEGDVDAIKKMIGLIESGRAMIIFAEGTRSDGITMLPLKQGVAMLAKKTGAPVVPIGIAGTQRLLPIKASTVERKRRQHVTVIYGDPFRYEDVAKGKNEKENRQLFLQALQSKLLALTEEAGIPLLPPAEACRPTETVG